MTRHNGPLNLAAVVLTAGAAVVGLAGYSVGSWNGFRFVDAARAQTQSADRESYIKQSEGRFEEWGRKIDAFSAKASERSAEAAEQAKRDIDQACSEVKTNWAKLRDTGKDHWDDAKSAFESSWRKLERAWKETQS